MDMHLDGASRAQVEPEARLWAAFATAGSTDSLCRSWLALQCRQLGGVHAAMLLLARPGGPFQRVAAWPDDALELGFLSSAAERCVRTAAPVIDSSPHEHGAGLRVAYPFLGEPGRQAGAVVLHMAPRPEREVRAALRALHWGSGWLEAQAMRDRAARERQLVERAAAALDLVAVANEHERADDAALAVANELAIRLGASRVAVGLSRDGAGVRIAALSHAAWFKRNSAMVRGLEAAMDEAMEQRATVRLPPLASDAVRIDVAHEALRAIWDCGSLATFPMASRRGAAGAIAVLHEHAPDEGAIRLGEAAAALLGPILDGKRRARRLVSGRLADGAREAAAAVAGPRHLAWKLTAATTAAAVAAAVVAPAGFRVSAKAVLEGRVQRAAPAPFDGFVATAPAHAGDLVRAGDVLATLDDRDLQLERVRWESERGRLALKSREAMARRDPASGVQLEAQLREADAQIDLVTEKLSRARIVAPVDGLVVSGDLSQSIGAPVETGRVLFEVAPLDEFRVIAQVDERDVRLVRPGQAGTLLLRGMTGEPATFTVRRVASVAEADAGRNTFRVEASLDGAPAGLRPGMEGVGKIEVARRSLAWVWTRGTVDWARMALWSWTP
jgi:multidrug resistance efflux pump